MGPKIKKEKDLTAWPQGEGGLAEQSCDLDMHALVAGSCPKSELSWEGAELRGAWKGSQRYCRAQARRNKCALATQTLPQRLATSAFGSVSTTCLCVKTAEEMGKRAWTRTIATV